MSETELKEDLKELRDLKLERDSLKELYDAAQLAFKAKEHDVFKRMQDHDDPDDRVGSTKVGETLFVPTSTVYSSVKDRDAFVAWAQEFDDSLVQEKERDAVLNELVRERLDNGEELPPGVGFYVREFISQRAG